MQGTSYAQQNTLNNSSLFVSGTRLLECLSLWYADLPPPPPPPWFTVAFCGAYKRWLLSFVIFVVGCFDVPFTVHCSSDVIVCQEFSSS